MLRKVFLFFLFSLLIGCIYHGEGFGEQQRGIPMLKHTVKKEGLNFTSPEATNISEGNFTASPSEGNESKGGGVGEKVEREERPRESFEWFLSPESWEVVLESNATIIDIDAFETPKAVVDELHRRNKTVIAYVSVGSWEEWRPDAGRFPMDVIGNSYPGWEGERLLDIRQIDKLAPVMEARLDMIAEKGFDGVEADNIDVYTFDSGFPLIEEDAVEYFKWLAKEAHKRNLSIGQKNAPELCKALVDYADWLLLEEAFATGGYKECKVYVERGKPVFAVEYTDEFSREEFFTSVCPKAKAIGYFAILKDRGLSKSAVICPN